ncbi:MAG: hypothetical protein HN416_13795 [Nitrospina sp.]|jgi:hypothetical protein|nr:hypothetical protein [Nitrospina sp.]
MGKEITEGSLIFTFPNSWKASCYDKWKFYRKHFAKICNETKAVDILALEPSNSCAWLIEVKDYRQHRRTKPSDLAEEVACKMKGTLAGLACGRLNAAKANEKQLSEEAMQAHKLRVVLHVEQPAKHSKLFPRAFDPADVKAKLRKKVRAIDPHPLVLEKANSTKRVDWIVT